MKSSFFKPPVSRTRETEMTTSWAKDPSPKRTMKLCLNVFTILAVLNGSLAARLGIRSASEKDQDWCKNGMEPEKYSLVNSVCEDCADIYKIPEVYDLCK